MARVTWSRRALRDLALNIDYIAVSNSAAAHGIGVRLIALGNSLFYAPNRGRPVGKFCELVSIAPYVLRYSVDDDVVTIHSIRHSRRRQL